MGVPLKSPSLDYRCRHCSRTMSFVDAACPHCARKVSTSYRDAEIVKYQARLEAHLTSFKAPGNDNKVAPMAVEKKSGRKKKLLNSVLTLVIVGAIWLVFRLII